MEQQSYTKDCWNGPCDCPEHNKHAFDDHTERVMDILRKKNENFEEYIKLYLSYTGLNITEVVLCHEYIPNGFKVYLDLKEKP